MAYALGKRSQINRTRRYRSEFPFFAFRGVNLNVTDGREIDKAQCCGVLTDLLQEISLCRLQTRLAESLSQFVRTPHVSV